jgi:hypothetical protein
MQILRTAVLVTCGVALAGCSDSTAPTPPQSRNLRISPNFASGGKDLVAGHGETPGIRFSVAATSGPLGEDPRGHLRIEIAPGGPVYEGEVRCLVVIGHRAAVGIEKQGDPSRGIFLYVEDNGNPGSLIPDRAADGDGTPPTQAECEFAFVAAEVASPVIQGNVEIKDALPAVP